jgi:hypothetical protein
VLGLHSDDTERIFEALWECCIGYDYGHHGVQNITATKMGMRWKRESMTYMSRMFAIFFFLGRNPNLGDAIYNEILVQMSCSTKLR